MFLPAVWITYVSCNKTSLTHLESYEQCNQKLQLDSSAILNRLVGKWAGTVRECTIGSSIQESALKLILDFKANDSFYISNTSGIITQGTWKLRNIGGGTFGLNVTSPSIYIQGRMLFCGQNRMVFDSAFVNGEGCSSFYYKYP